MLFRFALLLPRYPWVTGFTEITTAVIPFRVTSDFFGLPATFSRLNCPLHFHPYPHRILHSLAPFSWGAPLVSLPPSSALPASSSVLVREV